MSFETVIQHTLKEEAGYANAVADKGGETFRGISRVANPNWQGWSLVDDVKAKLKHDNPAINWRQRKTWIQIDQCFADSVQMNECVKHYYKAEYYDRVAAFGFSDRITDKLFDMNVNISPKGSNRILQNAINCLMSNKLVVDGVAGAKTKEAGRFLCESNEQLFLEELCDAQWHHYSEQFKPGGALYGFQNAKNSFYVRAMWQPE